MGWTFIGNTIVNRRGGGSWQTYWNTLISATVENAAPTNVVLTFPSARTSLGASDFTIAGFTISSASWAGTVLTLVLTEAVIYNDTLIVTFVTTGQTANVTNNVAALLNSYTGAAAAYSLRQIKSDYTGDCILVRRSTDDAELAIGFVNRVLDTASLLTFCGAGSGYVKTWYDQSGNGQDFTQTTDDAQPIIVNAGKIIHHLGKPQISFDGSDDYFAKVINGLSTAAALCVFTEYSAGRTIANTVTCQLWGLGDFRQGTYSLGRFASTGLLSGETMYFNVNRVNSGTNRLGSSGYSRLGNYPILDVDMFTSSGTKSYSNGTEITLNLTNDAYVTTNYTPAAGNITRSFHLSCALVDNAYIDFSANKYREVIIYPTDVTASRAAIESAIIAYYGQNTWSFTHKMTLHTGTINQAIAFNDPDNLLYGTNDVGGGNNRIYVYNYPAGTEVKNVTLALGHGSSAQYSESEDLLYVGNGNSSVLLHIYTVDINSATPSIQRDYDLESLGCGVFGLDEENGIIYAVTSATAGVGEDLVITPVDLITGTPDLAGQFTLPYAGIMQGACFYGGKIYLATGQTTTTVVIIDPILKRQDAAILMTGDGEPEGITLIDPDPFTVAVAYLASDKVWEFQFNNA